MSIKKIVVFIVLFLSLYFNVYALETNEIINPEWLKYIKLTEDEKKKYDAIPEKYINEYKKEDSLNTYERRSYVFDEYIPTYFSLADNEGKQYVNSSSKNQSSLGLCWAFGAIGSAESNILLNGVKGQNNLIDLCNNDNSLYCKYKEDYELNEQYKLGLVKDNATFSERVTDYITSKPINASAYGRDGLYTVISEGYNPYTASRSFGSGGSFSTVGNLYSSGITPIRTFNEWASYNTNLTEMSLYQVFDSVDNIYQVTDYYNYPSAPSDSASKENWIKELKKNIMKYGSVYVSTVAPQVSSARACYYYDTKYNINGEKKYIHLINYDGKCGTGSLGWHAMQIIGWDDEYSFGYCKVGNSSSGNYTKSSCENAGYIWTEGKGAWILKNSWGTTKTYPYLSYQSTGLSISGVREVSIKDYDNSYNRYTSINNYTRSKINLNGNNVYENIYKFRKPIDIEYLNNINVYFSSYNNDYQIYISNDGVTYEFISEGKIDYSGLKTFYTNDFKLTNEDFYIKVVNNNVSYVNAFTKNECSKNNNCDNSLSISTVMDKKNYEDTDRNFKIFNKTRNISSGSKITYKILNEQNEDITNLFNIPNTYIINNIDSFTMTSNKNLEMGRYKLISTYENISNEYEFSVLGDEINLELEKVDKLFLEDKTYKINYKLSTTAGVNSYNWSVDDESIATINNNGTLTLKDSGKIKVKLSLDTVLGIIEDEIEIIIYKKINNIDDFLNIMTDTNNTKAYFLNTDLDFKDIDFDKLNLSLYFRGIFEGNYHTIKNINRTSNISGLFPYLDGATVSNIKIIDSSFTGDEFVGSLAGFADNSKIFGIYNTSSVFGKEVVGGIIGLSNNTTISECYNGSNIVNNSDKLNLYAGGIVGHGIDSIIKDSYNEGKVNIVSNDEVNNINAYATGIISYSSNTTITNTYNTGIITIESLFNNTLFYKSGISNNYDNVNNSYYIKDATYTIIDENYEKTIEEMKQKSNYLNWDFNNIWQIVDNKYTPILRKFPIEITNINFDIFSKTLNTNYEYDFNYEVLPYNASSDVEIKSDDTNLFEVINNKIITKDKVGSSYITFIVDDKEYSFPITVVNLFDIEYDNTLTGNYVDINTNYNYYLSKLNNEYIKLDYSINDKFETHSFEKNVISDKYTIRVDNNGKLNIKLYLCNDNSCEVKKTEEFDINNIDKTRPVIKYETNNIKKTLKINITDDNGLSLNNDYSYGLSSSDKLVPTLKKYKLNTLFTDLSLSNENYYLWIKRVFDKSGNGLCDTTYCIYKLNLEDNYYTLNYYDEDNKTLLKSERYLENTRITPTFNPKKESTEDFDYIFDSWIGYTKGMKLTKNTSFVAKYRGIFRGLSSKIYIIENGIIKNIKTDNINSKYSVDKFKSNITSNEIYNFYENNIIYPEYIKTGMIYKSNYRSFIISLSGDVTGDGLIKMNDVMKIANEIVNGNILKNEYYFAGDVTGDGFIKMNDVMKIASGLVNGGNL